MQVQEVMTPSPCACGPGANLSEAIQMMWEGDFGILPVVDDVGHVLGIVTDRDIAIAAGTRNVPASQIPVSDVMTREVQVCHPHNGIPAALALMRERRVRRLPVVDDADRLCGLLSLNDAVLAAGDGVSGKTLVDTLRAVCEHRRPSPTPLVTAA